MRKLLCIMLVTLSASLFASGDQELQAPRVILTTIYVDSNAQGKGDGSSWQDGYNNLNYALGAAQSGSEIWVAAGTYNPSKGDSSVSFNMKDGVDVYGGFTGNETELTQRDWEKNITILSGEIGDTSRIEDNSLTVVSAANSILDGFTISNGYGLSKRSMGGPSGEMGPPPGQSGSSSGQSERSSEQSERPSGPPPGQSDSSQSSGQTGGQSRDQSSMGHSSPDQIMSAGSQPGTGSGIQIWQVSPEIRNCKIINNQSNKGGGIYIVGVSSKPEAKSKNVVMPLFENCLIANNTAIGRGGGVSIDMGGSAIFIDTIFKDNSCLEGKGGAIYNDFGCSPYLINCLFTGNYAESGAAMGNDGSSNPIIYNCTFTENEALIAGAALYQGSGPYNDPIVVNSVIWENLCQEDENSIYNWHECNTQVSYSIVEGGYDGQGILDQDPLFLGDGSYGFENASPIWTLGTNGSAAGFDPSLLGKRTQSDLEALIATVKAIPNTKSPQVIDLSNPLKSAGSIPNGVIYVTTNGTGEGTSWEDSTSSVQDAIDWANLLYKRDGDPIYVWVAKGTYYPGDERNDSFILREGVILYGGFKGDETTLFQRNSSDNITVLSGNIGDKSDATDNSYHVLVGADKVIVDGLTITGGYADGADGGEVYDNKGGALLNYLAGNRVKPTYTPSLGFDLTLKNVTFVDNYAEEGGAVYTYHGGNPVFEDCFFTDNRALYGGATVDRAGTNSFYVNCQFSGNEAVYKGGALFVDYGSMATVSESLFIANKAGACGGAIYVIDRASQETPNQTAIALIDPAWENNKDIFSSVLVVNSSFKNNFAERDGGALYVYEGSNAKMSGATFEENKAGGKGDLICLINKATLYLSESIQSSDKGIYKDNQSTIVNE